MKTNEILLNDEINTVNIKANLHNDNLRIAYCFPNTTVINEKIKQGEDFSYKIVTPQPHPYTSVVNIGKDIPDCSESEFLVSFFIGDNDEEEIMMCEFRRCIEFTIEFIDNTITNRAFIHLAYLYNNSVEYINKIIKLDDIILDIDVVL